MSNRKLRIVGNLVVGDADVKPTASSHVPGVLQGNSTHAGQRRKGIEEHQDYAIGTARRSTGIRPDDHDTIDPRMPKLSPA